MKQIIMLLAILVFQSCAKKIEHKEIHAGSKEEQIQENIALEVASLPEVEKGEESFIEYESQRAMGPMYRAGLIQKMRAKREQQSLFSTNEKLVKTFGNHSQIYPFQGKYKVMVIPVQFKDFKFEDPRFFKTNPEGKSEAQEYLFGNHKNSMTNYYKHVSLGKLKLDGTVTDLVTVDGNLADYGEAVANSSDKDAKGLVVQALKKLKEKYTDKNWWLDFDNWDLSDYDKDSNFYEADGFIDAVVLIYAGKSQASCQSDFDPEGKRPSSSEVPDGPRKKATLECFNRIWPHRWAISLSKDHPDFQTEGPIVEGRQRPAMNGLKITDELFALDYNMQSEFSDRSTFIHEFGHSLSLPDVYSRARGNSTGSWEIMSSNANLQAQEMSSYSKITLGWISPKIIEEGETTSAYLGNFAFVSNKRREEGSRFNGPTVNYKDESILSEVPDTNEDVYRSVMVPTSPTDEKVKVIEKNEKAGSVSAYTGRFNNGSKSLTFNFKVLENDKIFSFESIWHIETETNFTSAEEEIKVVTDYDIVQVEVNGKVLKKMRLISGDINNNTLNESIEACLEEEVLELRKKKIKKIITEEEEKVYKKLIEVCQKPSWVKETFDLSEYVNQEVELKINYITDPGYTEFGMVVDNIKVPGNAELITFENSEDFGEWKKLVEGEETITFKQAYLMEYRAPGQDFSLYQNELSYNYDNNIDVGTQSMFVGEGNNPVDKFRLVKFNYQPGVLVWYFNSKYDRGPFGNDPASNGGKGYLLVLNSHLKEVPIPGVFSHPSFFDENGNYPTFNLEKDPKTPLEVFAKKQRDDFVCFAYTKYHAYTTGEEANCEGDYKDFISKLTMNGKKLIYRRERFNETLPKERYFTVGVGKPYRTGSGMRTGLSTFRPKESKNFSPFQVYKVEDNKMVIDEELTNKSYQVKPVSVFSDSENKMSENKNFHGDTVVVEKKGFSFEVVSPNPRVLNRYSERVGGEDNDNSLRAPRVKVYFDWK